MRAPVSVGPGGAVGPAGGSVAGASSKTPTRGELVAELSHVVGVPHEARFIVDEALGLGLPLGASVPTGPLDEATVASARAMAERRRTGEPLQYVFGHWPFRRLDLRVDPRVLIPRPETEQVVEIALREARRLAEHRSGLVIADAGTGSGAIALALASELGSTVAAEAWATDASADALAVARSNLETLRRAQPARTQLAPTTLARGTWLEPLPPRLRGAVDLVVSNPPYVSEAEWEGLAAEVRREPREALVAAAASDGTPGLADVEIVLDQARGWLRRLGVVVIELAPHQAGAAVALADRLGYAEPRVEPDLARRPRALVARTGARV